MEDEKLANNSIFTANVLNNGHSGLLINGNGSSYENALKKLVFILKFKASDNLKQLEDLWDSINVPAPQPVTSKPIVKSESNVVLSRTTPSPPLSNSSCSNSSTISDSSASSPSSASSSSSSPSPPRVSPAAKSKQPPSPGKPTKAETTLKRDASKMTSNTSEQDAKKPKLNATSNSSTTKKNETPATKTTTAAATKNAAKKQADNTAKTSTAKSSATAATTKAKAANKSDESKSSSSTSKSSVKEANGSSSDSSPPPQQPSKTAAKRDLTEAAESRAPPERPSSFAVASVSVKEEELNKLEEGKSIEITFDDSMLEVNTNSNTLNHHHLTTNTSLVGGSASSASSMSSNQVNTQSASSNTGLIDGCSSVAKRIKLDQIDSSAAAVSNGGGSGLESDIGETSQVDFDDMLTGLSCSVCKKFNQETNNKLIECRNCKYMFHQLCHKPPLSQDELEEQYISKCFECIHPGTTDSESSSSVSRGDLLLTEESTSVQHSKDSPTAPLTLQHVNAATSTAKRSDSLTEQPALLNSPKSQQLTGGSSGMKGLAALATKFNPTQSAQTPTSTSSSMSKNNDLFNKFKQSATTPASSPNDTLLNKSKSPFMNVAASAQTAQQQKRNIFNIASSK